MPRKATKPPTPEGEVVMASKDKVPAPKPQPPPPPPPPAIQEVSASKYENELRPKKDLSEKQKANLAKLIERNKQKAIERRVVVKEIIPESIPEDKVLVRVKPKRVYNRKPKEETVKNVVVEPTPEPTPAPSETEQSESEVEVKPKRVRKPAPRKKIVPKYSYETETTTADEDSDSDSDDDYKVAKYNAKAQKRMKALEKIDSRLKQLQNNPYQSRELSIF